MTEIHTYLDSLAKPIGSLGKLEELASHLGRIQSTVQIRTTPRRLVIFAADHGVVEEGVSLWPSSLTSRLAKIIENGTSASACLAKASNTEVQLIDVGLSGPALEESNGILKRKVREGTRNLAVEPALTVDEFFRAISVGEELATQAVNDGIEIVCGGEIGIGNTTIASCVSALLADVPLKEVIGKGAGCTPVSLARKTEAVARGVLRAREMAEASEIEAIASICGLEVAALAGFYKKTALARRPIILDGFVSTAAALIAERLWPGTKDVMIAAHTSAEPGHKLALSALKLTPFFNDWNMRLGEGTGALLLVPILDCAASITNGMAKLNEL